MTNKDTFKVEEFKELLQKNGFEVQQVRKGTDVGKNAVFFTVRKDEITTTLTIFEDEDTPLLYHIANLKITVAEKKEELSLDILGANLRDLQLKMKDLRDKETIYEAIEVVHKYRKLREESWD